MAAPESSKCEKCFNAIPPGAATCPECGAPVKDASTTEAEAVVYPELARANLARMRGDYKQAEDQLLSILKRYPNNPSANEMLGDLAAEREDYPHALEWYEMALDIVPTSASIARKLREARAHVEQKTTQDTTAQLGLPDPSSRLPVVIGSLIILFLAVAAGAYYLGIQSGGGAKSAATVHLQAQPEQSSGSSSNKTGDTSQPPPKTPTSNEEDQDLLKTLAAKSQNSASILGVTRDPRAGLVVVTFAMPEQESRSLAAKIASETLDAFPDVNTVTIRGVSQGKIAYMADVARTNLAETQTPEYQQQHQNDPTAWINAVLHNEWPAPASPPTSNSTTPPGNETNPTTTPGSALPATTTATGGG